MLGTISLLELASLVGADARSRLNQEGTPMSGSEFKQLHSTRLLSLHSSRQTGQVLTSPRPANPKHVSQTAPARAKPFFLVALIALA